MHRPKASHHITRFDGFVPFGTLSSGELLVVFLIHHLNLFVSGYIKHSGRYFAQHIHSFRKQSFFAVLNLAYTPNGWAGRLVCQQHIHTIYRNINDLGVKRYDCFALFGTNDLP